MEEKPIAVYPFITRVWYTLKGNSKDRYHSVELIENLWDNELIRNRTYWRVSVVGEHTISHESIYWKCWNTSTRSIRGRTTARRRIQVDTEGLEVTGIRYTKNGETDPTVSEQVIFGTGSTIISQGEENFHFFWVSRGKVRFERKNKDQDPQILYHNVGDCFGEASFVDWKASGR